MDILRTVPTMQAEAEAARCAGRTLALVPTMGALHRGHLALVEEARERVGPEGHVAVSIFVNPTQFGPNEDFDAYPRTLDADLDALRSAGGVDAVFAPSVDEMYPEGAATLVRVAGLGEHLCGAHRPGHFDGVTTIVTKLLVACRPHVAVFGKKDAQQFLILRRMARDLGFGVEIAGVETVREADGLALSSRNRYLDPVQREQAGALSAALLAGRYAAGEGTAAALVRTAKFLDHGGGGLIRHKMSRQFGRNEICRFRMPRQIAQCGFRLCHAAAAIGFAKQRVIPRLMQQIDE